MTDQELFDIVATHLLTQKCVARTGSDNNCAYRGSNNTKCAIGVLIPDDIYRPEMEGRGVIKLMECYDEVSQLFKHITYDLLRQLQWIHDDGVVGGWLNKLERLADNKGLNTTVLDKFKNA